MLKCIVVIQFVALLSLSLAGTSIADPPKPLTPAQMEQLEIKRQNEAQKAFKQALDEAARKNPQPSTGPKAAGSTASHTKGKQ
jgi:hypothetical protein